MLPILQYPVYLTIRGAASVVLVPGPAPALRFARAAARRYATAPWNRKRLKRAADNLRVAYPDWDQDRIDAYAIRSYEHLFSLGVELSLAPRLFSTEGWPRYIEIGDVAPAVYEVLSNRPCLLVTGHVGNWELVGYWLGLIGIPVHALYRPMDLKPFDDWIRQVRARRGLMLVDKFGAVRELPRLMAAALPVAFVADQNGGDRGVFVPYFNRLCSSYKSIGLLAMQFGATLVCGCARRVGDLDRGEIRYRIELTDVFGPADWATHPDPLFYLTARFRRAIEAMIRKDPGQYDWMHRVWRSRPRHERLGRPFPAKLEEKLRLLPWMTDADLARIKEHSARDARTLAETGQSRLS